MITVFILHYMKVSPIASRLGIGKATLTIMLGLVIHDSIY